MDPSNSQRLYYGATHVYQTNNAAGTWQAISPALTSDPSGFSSVAAMAVAPSNSDYVYVGMAAGGVWVTQNATLGTSSTWTNVTAGLASRAVTGIAVNPTAPATAYVLLSGFSGFGDTKGHIFKTVDAGAHWADISGNLPNLPLNDCVVDPDVAGTLYVASDMAVFVSTNDGGTWNVMGSGMPKVIVHSLKLHRPTRTLRAATFGRGMWDIQVPVPGNTAPALSVSMSHQGIFSPAQTDAAYQVTVANGQGAGATAGMLTLAETVPYGLTLVSMAGDGWNCTNPACTRSDSLGAGKSYPAVTVTVAVAFNAPAQLANQVNLSGGSSAPASAVDLTAVGNSPCDPTGDVPVSSGDVVVIAQDALTTNTAGDLNKDGSVNVVDVQIVVNAADGGACTAK